MQDGGKFYNIIAAEDHFTDSISLLQSADKQMGRKEGLGAEIPKTPLLLQRGM